jgi:type II secretory pathway predicted ATPase ExeA
MGALLGESGVGKSMVLRVAAKQLVRRRWVVVPVDALAATTRELLWQIACGLKTAPREDTDVAWLWRQIADRVIEHRMQQVGTVLLVDDAGQAGPDLMMQFARLARLDPAASARWTIVLAAEPAQAARWNETLRNLVDLRIDVATWNREETIGYVQTALVEAGRFEPVFEESALAALHDLSRGLPRQVARLADFALVAGAAASVETIDAAIVEGANEEIAWPTATRAY